MRYFIDVVNFVDSILLWIVLVFLLACVIELIVFLCMKKGGPFNTDGFFMCAASNLMITLGLYILACLGVGFVNCIADQDWHFFTNYVQFMQGVAASVIFSIVYWAAAVCIFIFCKIDSCLGRLIVSALGAILVTAAAVIAGFLIYVIVAILIIILKLIWFVVSGFFQSIFQFIVKYWQTSITVLVGPGVIYGAYCAFINYVKSFKSEVLHK